MKDMMAQIGIVDDEKNEEAISTVFSWLSFSDSSTWGPYAESHDTHIFRFLKVNFPKIFDALLNTRVATYEHVDGELREENSVPFRTYYPEALSVSLESDDELKQKKIFRGMEGGGNLEATIRRVRRGGNKRKGPFLRGQY